MRARFLKSDKKIIIHEGRFLRFISKGEWEYCERCNCTGAVIIMALTDKNELIFVEQYRAPLGKKVIEFPAGLMNDQILKKKESLIEAAKRELLEETGYAAKNMKVILHGPVSSGFTSDMATMVLATKIKKLTAGGGQEAEGENITVYKVAIKNTDRWLKSMEKKGRLVEPKIYAGLYLINKHTGIS